MSCRPSPRLFYKERPKNPSLFTLNPSSSIHWRSRNKVYFLFCTNPVLQGFLGTYYVWFRIIRSAWSTHSPTNGQVPDKRRLGKKQRDDDTSSFSPNWERPTQRVQENSGQTQPGYPTSPSSNLRSPVLICSLRRGDRDGKTEPVTKTVVETEVTYGLPYTTKIEYDHRGPGPESISVGLNQVKHNDIFL